MPTILPVSTAQSTNQSSQDNISQIIDVLDGFLSSMVAVLLIGFAWLYLIRLLLRVLGLKTVPQNLVQYPSDQARREHTRMIFKLLIMGGSFLIVGSAVSFFLRSYPVYLIVSWIILIIFFSNILNQELRIYYRVGLDQVLTTLHTAAVKVTHLKQPRVTGHTPDLRAFTDTTAYLQALRRLFRRGGIR